MRLENIVQVGNQAVQIVLRVQALPILQVYVRHVQLVRILLIVDQDHVMIALVTFIHMQDRLSANTA